MDTPTSLLIFQITCCIGFSLWLSISLINNLQAFASSAGAIGETMSMAPLAQPPGISLPLLVRAMTPHAIHRLALSIIVLTQQPPFSRPGSGATNCCLAPAWRWRGPG